MLIVTSLVYGLLTCLVAFYASFLWRRRRLYHLAGKIPGPIGLPVIGMAHKFILADFKQMFETLVNTPIGYKSIMKIWLGPELVIFAATPEALQIVLNSQKCLNKSSLYDVIGLAKGLIVGGGQLWKKHRKILNPSFNISVLQRLIPTFDEKSKLFVKNLEQEVGKKEFDVYVYMSACSLETLLKGTMEIDRDIQSNPQQNDYLHNVDLTAQILMKKVFNLMYWFEPIRRMTEFHQLEQKYMVNGILKIADEICIEKRELKSMLVKGKETSCDYSGHKNNSKNFINILLDSENGFSEDEIKDEINSLVAAGHETSALVISNTLLMLAMHPEVQQKVVQELKEVYGSAGAVIDYESLNKLSYLDMVFKESMRLFPVLPISARKATEEFEIGEFIVPAGATIVISAFTVQRSKEFWGDDADQFRPERFEPENFKKVHPYAFIPFTGGPRICIGWRYGMLFMKSVVANFLRKYEVNTSMNYDELELEITISLKISQHWMISLEKRDF